MTTDAPLPQQVEARAAPGRRGLYALGACVSLGLAVWLVAIAARTHPSSPPGPLTIAGIIAAFACAIGFFVALVWSSERVRVQKLADAANALGLAAVARIPRDARASLFQPFAGLAMLRSGQRGMRFHSEGERRGRRVDLIEHAYVVSTGKTTHVVVHTAAATPCPPAWPRLSLTPRGVFTKLWESLAGKDLQVESDAFNDRWTIKCDNRDFAVLFLSPEVQAFLTDAPSHETWHVAGGSLCWVARQAIKPPMLAESVERVATLRGTLPAELDHWGN